MQPPEEDRNARRSAAVQLLNNHLPVLGGSHRGDYGAPESDYLMDHVPAAVKDPFMEALANAARFLAADFAAEKD